MLTGANIVNIHTKIGESFDNSDIVFSQVPGRNEALLVCILVSVH